MVPAGDGLLADVAVQRLVRDATAAAASQNRSFAGPSAPETARPTPIPSGSQRERNACPMTGYLGEEGEARMKLANNVKNLTARNKVTCTLVGLFSLGRYFMLYTRGGTHIGHYFVGPLILTCVTASILPLLGFRKNWTTGSDVSVHIGALLCYCVVNIYTYSHCSTDPNPMLCSVTEYSIDKTIKLGPLLMFFGATFLISIISIDFKHLIWRERLAICLGSQVVIVLSHVFFLEWEVRIVMLKLLVFIMGSTFFRVYLLERQLRILFLIESEIENSKQRHFFSMQAHLGEKLSRIADIAWYLKTTPLDPESVRTGVFQMQLDNRMMSKATRTLKVQLLKDNGQLAPLTADCNTCPLQGWGLPADQNRLLHELYNRPDSSAAETDKALFATEMVGGLLYTESGLWPMIYNTTRKALGIRKVVSESTQQESPNLFRILACAFIAFGSFLYVVEAFYMMSDILPWRVWPAAFLTVFTVTCVGIYLRKTDKMHPLAKKFGTFLLLASPTMSVFVFSLVERWKPEDVGNLQVDVQYLNVLGMFFNAHAYYRLTLQTQFCDFSWRFAFLYNFAVGLAGWLVCTYIVQEHPAFWFVQVCGMMVIMGTAISRYDHEKIMRKCFLAERMNQQAQANAFFTVMHDFNQPCNVITNCCDLLLTPLTASETAEVLTCLTVSVGWQTQLVKSAWIQEQLLGNAIMVPTYHDNVNMETLLAECLTIGKGYFFGGGLPVRLTCEISAEVPKGVRIDQEWVKRFILNLVSNSIKFTLEGSIAIRVSTYTTRSEKDPARVETGLCFSVADTGSGIPEHKVNRLFCKFEQLHDINRGGTGLGLWSMKHLAEAMHGRCGYTPNKPSGSVFWFQVPCCSVPTCSMVPLPTHSSNTQLEMVDPVPRTTANGQANQKHVVTSKALFVDDDRMAYFVVSRILRRMGIELQGACDGTACLSLLKASTAHCFSCVFMDLMMPRMGGAEAIKEFRRWESIYRVGQRRQAICIVSGSHQLSSHFKLMGADFMLSKPCEAKRMKAIIEQVIGDSSWPQVQEGAPSDYDTDCDHRMVPHPFLRQTGMLVSSVAAVVDTQAAESEQQATPMRQQSKQRVAAIKRKLQDVKPTTGATTGAGIGTRTRAKASKMA